MSVLEIIILASIFTIGGIILTIMIVKAKKKKKQKDEEDEYE